MAFRETLLRFQSQVPSLSVFSVSFIILNLTLAPDLRIGPSPLQPQQSIRLHRSASLLFSEVRISTLYDHATHTASILDIRLSQDMVHTLKRFSFRNLTCADRRWEDVHMQGRRRRVVVQAGESWFERCGFVSPLLGVRSCG